MQLNTLTPAKGAIKKRKRIGRGQGSGKGRTAARGHKGYQSRSGSKTRPHSEGGQMPLQRRLPKVGFKSFSHITYRAVNLDTLQLLTEKLNISTIDHAVLLANSLVGKGPYKILGKGKDQLKAKLSVSAHAFSASAKRAIEKLGGNVIISK